MQHCELMAGRHEPDRNDPNPACLVEVEAVHRGFWDDVSWTVYRCPSCRVALAAVGGGRHWWNYVLSPESAARLGVLNT